jgi:PEP-CTERM motif-containing protein
MLSRIRSPRTLLLTLAIATCCAWGASADPIVVTTGAYIVHSGDPSLFHFIGNQFNVFGDARIDVGLSGPLRTCNPCSGGAAVDLSSHLSGNVGEWVNRPDFPAQVGGATYPTVFYSGDLLFNAPTIPAPDPSQTHSFVFNEPFTFSGQLSGFPTAARNTAPLFSTALSGNGAVTFSIFADRFGERQVFTFGDLDYTFAAESTSPTPEPATVFLLGTAIVGALGRRLRRR